MGLERVISQESTLEFITKPGVLFKTVVKPSSMVTGQYAKKVFHALLHGSPSVLPEDMSEKSRVGELLYSRNGLCEVLGNRGKPLKGMRRLIESVTTNSGLTLVELCTVYPPLCVQL